MSLTSLGIASNGLLDRGLGPSLHIGSLGLLRIDGQVQPPASTGGGGRSRFTTDIARAAMRRRERLERLKRELTPEAQQIVMQAEALGGVDLNALERRIEATRDELAQVLEALEGQERARARALAIHGAVDLDVSPGEIVRSDINLRLLLLLGC